MPFEFSQAGSSKAVCQIGFLYPRRAKLSLRARHTVGVLKRFLATNCADYFAHYPLD